MKKIFMTNQEKADRELVEILKKYDCLCGRSMAQGVVIKELQNYTRLIRKEEREAFVIDLNKILSQMPIAGNGRRLIMSLIDKYND